MKLSVSSGRSVEMRRRAARAGIVLVVLGASVAALVGPLAHALPAPPVLAPGRWHAWLTAAGSDRVTAGLTAAFGVLRLAALVLAAWLAMGVVAALALELAGARSKPSPVAAQDVGRRIPRTGVVHRLAAAVDAAVPRPILALAAVLLGATAAGCARPMAGTHGIATGVEPRDAPTATTPVTVTITRTGSAGPAGAPRLQMPAARAAPGGGGWGKRATAPSPHAAGSAGEPAVWRVRPGESMWIVAEAVVRSNGGGAADVAPYWLQLMGANPEPNPDLVYAGQRLEVPPYPG